ncbi:MAG: FtsX-like permease family protein, partial [Acidobacteriota bacterium]
RWAAVSDDFFRTLDVTLDTGRVFTATEAWEDAAVAVVNRRFAERFFGEEGAIGQRFRFVNQEEARTIVGVVPDFKTTTLDRRAPSMAFIPIGDRVPRETGIMVRAAGTPESVMSVVREHVRRLDPGIPVYDLTTMQQVRERVMWQFEVISRLFTLFGGLALILAATGLYGVLSYIVSRRWREIGIRMAIGARRGAVIRYVMRQGLRLVVIGVIIGLACAFFLSRLLASFLYGITAGDPLSFVGLTVFLLAVAALACFIPAQRATRVDPAIVLQEN